MFVTFSFYDSHVSRDARDVYTTMCCGISVPFGSPKLNTCTGERTGKNFKKCLVNEDIIKKATRSRLKKRNIKLRGIDSFRDENSCM